MNKNEIASVRSIHSEYRIPTSVPFGFIGKLTYKNFDFLETF